MRIMIARVSGAEKSPRTGRTSVFYRYNSALIAGGFSNSFKGQRRQILILHLKQMNYIYATLRIFGARHYQLSFLFPSYKIPICLNSVCASRGDKTWL